MKCDALRRQDTTSNKLRQAHLHRLREATNINDINTTEVCKALFHEGYESRHPAVKETVASGPEAAGITTKHGRELTAILMQTLRQEQTGRASWSEAPRMLPVLHPAQMI